MIRTPEELRELTRDLSSSVWTLAAIGVLFESGLVDQLREPRSFDELSATCPGLARSHMDRCIAVGVAVGLVVAEEGGKYRLAEGAAPFSQGPGRVSLQGDIRSQLMQPLAFLDAVAAKDTTTGWRHTNVALLQAQGDASAGFAPMFKMKMIAALGDLEARLDRPDARFLDVGVGVGSLAIAMCRVFPKLRAVGLDIFEVPLALARENVTRAGLGERIELRQLAVEKLDDEEAFELAWLPSVFIPSHAMATATARVRASLRPGGWMLFPVMGTGDDRQRAVYDLTNELWGGARLSPAEAESVLKSAGLSSVRTLPGPSWAPALVVGQR